MNISQEKIIYGALIGLLVFYFQSSINKVEKNNIASISIIEKFNYVSEKLEDLDEDLKENTKSRWTKDDHDQYAMRVDAEIKETNRRMTEVARTFRADLSLIKDLLHDLKKKN